MNRVLNEASWARLINGGLLFFLFAAVLLPWDGLGKAGYYLVVAPLVALGRVRGYQELRGADEVIRLSLALIGYVVLASALTSDAPLDRHFKEFRWGIETAILLLALKVAVTAWTRDPAFYGRLFAGVALAASAITLFNYFRLDQFPARLVGHGFLDHAIIGPSVLVVFWALSATLFGVGGNARLAERFLLLTTLVAVAAVCFFSMSRGPLLSLLIYTMLITVAYLITATGPIRKLALAVFIGVVLAALGVGVATTGLESAVENMIARGDSYRFDIWLATIENPPSPLLLGEGAATPFEDTAAGQAAVERTGASPIPHPHNLLLSVYFFSGLAGLLLLLGVIILVLRRAVCSDSSRFTKWLLCVLVALGLMLNMTEGHRVVVSPDPVWVMFWIPVIFVAVLSRGLGASVYSSARNAAGVAESDPQGG